MKFIKRVVSNSRYLAATLALASSVFPSPFDGATIRFHPASQEEVQSKLQRYGGNNKKRQETMQSLFAEAGCPQTQISLVPVKGVKESDVLCTLPGKRDSVIIVGAHFDKVDIGDGVVDNWSGASLLPSIYQAVAAEPRQHTFVFIAFSGEERGLLGSHSYAQSISKAQISKIHAMINMDTLGLGPTAVWINHSDPNLVKLAATTAASLRLPISGVNADKVGDSDESSFRELKIPCLMIHSVTQKTLSVLHSTQDRIKAIQVDDYYNTYKFLCGLLVYSDQMLAAPADRQ